MRVCDCVCLRDSKKFDALSCSLPFHWSFGTQTFRHAMLRRPPGSMMRWHMAQKVILHVALPMIPQSQSSTGRMMVEIQEKQCTDVKFWPLTQRKARQSRLALPSDIIMCPLSVLLYDSLHVKMLLLRYKAHPDRFLTCFPNHREIWLSHQMLKSTWDPITTEKKKKRSSSP